MPRPAPAKWPGNPRFSSGPCTKRPGWTPAVLERAFVGRSHRAAEGKARLAEVIERSKRLLGMPEEYLLAIVPASDTGAVELALWNLLGPRGVDVLAWESFGRGWARDVESHLRLPDVRVIESDYGVLPDLGQVDTDRDVVFAWNGTTSGVCVADGNWIADDRAGLTICDATSAVFAMALPWEKLDVVTWSWQKVLGGEAAHGMLALGPRAVERIESHDPSWPLPKIFRLKEKGRLLRGLFEGATINTPSMLCVEDLRDALDWAESQGGLAGLIDRTTANFAAVSAWVRASDWVEFLARDPETRSPTSICLRIVDPWFLRLADEERAAFVNAMVRCLEEEGAAYDVGSYRAAPPGLRIWGGATVEKTDIAALLPWLDWAYHQTRELRTAA